MLWDLISVTRKKTVRNTNIWRLNNTFLNNQQVPEEIKREIKKISRNKWQWKHDNSNPMGCSKSSSKREVYSNTILPQGTRKMSNRKSNFTPKTTGKRSTKKKKKISRRKEILKFQAEINGKKIEETIVKINKTKSFVLWEDKQDWQTFSQTHQEKKREESNQQN